MSKLALQIEAFDFLNSDRADYAAAAEFFNRMRAERMPDDPPMAVDEYISEWQNIPPFVRVEAWGVRVDDTPEIVAGASGSYLLTEENRHLLQFQIDVLPEYRRRGIGKRLLRHVAGIARRENRSLMMSETSDRIPAGEVCMQRVGARRGQANHTNQLKIAGLDRSLVQRWLAQAAERASAFELGFWDGPYPEVDIDQAVRLYDVMNSMPRDDLEVEDFHLTREQLRQMEQGMAGRGTTRWTLYVRERATGTVVGYTEVLWHPARPALLNQGGTGVFPNYRNLGLGRWLKAAMLDKVLRERPQIKLIRTGNADSNAAMLKINVELGFKPYSSNIVWQVETDTVFAYLDA